MAETGRPPIEIDWAEFDKLCQMQCTLEEIAAWFDCHTYTIERRCKDVHGMLFSDYYKKKAAGGKISLRRKQMQVALSGNVSMLIWLGKQYLNQSDKAKDEAESQPPSNKLTAEERRGLVLIARQGMKDADSKS